MTDSGGVAYPCGSDLDPQPTGAAVMMFYDHKNKTLGMGVVGSPADNNTLQTFWLFQIARPHRSGTAFAVLLLKKVSVKTSGQWLRIFSLPTTIPTALLCFLCFYLFLGAITFLKPISYNLQNGKLTVKDGKLTV